MYTLHVSCFLLHKSHSLPPPLPFPPHFDDVLAGSEDESGVRTVLDIPDIAEVLLQGEQLSP